VSELGRKAVCFWKIETPARGGGSVRSSGGNGKNNSAKFARMELERKEEGMRKKRGETQPTPKKSFAVNHL